MFFRSLFIRFNRVSLQLFENGTANLTGIKTMEQGHIDMQKFCKAVGTSISSYKITTITATATLDFNFENLKRHPDAEYEPEIYPAIYFNSDKGKAVLFRSGKVNFVGIKFLERVNEIFNEIKVKISYD